MGSTKREEKVFTAVRVDQEMARAMQRLHARDGITSSEQIRRALGDWLRTKRVGYAPKRKEKVR